eukprot:6154834-Prymnesium_polylepis.1
MGRSTRLGGWSGSSRLVVGGVVPATILHRSGASVAGKQLHAGCAAWSPAYPRLSGRSYPT